eukprot:scaffold549_cov385-Prasinococcus_capsulatus_cf.AAC.43
MSFDRRDCRTDPGRRDVTCTGSTDGLRPVSGLSSSKLESNFGGNKSTSRGLGPQTTLPFSATAQNQLQSGLDAYSLVVFAAGDKLLADTHGVIKNEGERGLDVLAQGGRVSTVADAISFDSTRSKGARRRPAPSEQATEAARQSDSTTLAEPRRIKHRRIRDRANKSVSS